MRALVADDDTASRLLLQRMLTKWGYDVVTASEGEEAWSILTSDNSPDLAVLDWMMPGLDGVEVCRRVRALDLSSPPYLILLTSRGDKQDIATGLESGASDYVQKPFDHDELRARLLVGRRFAELNSKLLETQRELQRQALTDPLTHIMNRRAILGRLTEEMARAPRQGLPLSIGVMDIDHFKLVNDRYGHAGGDSVLQTVVERSLRALRAYDALGRIGGEEFLIVMPGVGARDASVVLERIRHSVRQTNVEVQGAEITVTVSVGGAVNGGETPEELLHLADEALYRAKGEGRDRVVIAPRKVSEAEMMLQTSQAAAPAETE
ncbi:MAG: diguanylate cyclase [Thermoleophilia bacterium]|nr:diguanylate cyclase [Thermoleophilia bacterium]